MKTSICQPPSSLERAVWRRQEAEDEARWEAQIRRLREQQAQKPRPPTLEPARASVATLVSTRLEISGRVRRRDTLLIARTLPLLSGSDDEDLLCGKCSVVICARTSRQFARRQHPEAVRLLARCTCGALNLLG